MDLLDLLREVELFDGLTDEDLREIARLCRSETHARGDLLSAPDRAASELFVVAEGFVEVLPGEEEGGPKTVVDLGPGQTFGEIALVNPAARPRAVRAVQDGTVLQRIDPEAFLRLCEENTHLGFVVMRNLAADLAFRLEHRAAAHR